MGGENSFDYETGTTEIVRFTEWDTMNSNAFAKNGDLVHP